MITSDRNRQHPLSGRVCDERRGWRHSDQAGRGRRAGSRTGASGGSGSAKTAALADRLRDRASRRDGSQARAQESRLKPTRGFNRKLRPQGRMVVRFPAETAGQIMLGELEKLNPSGSRRPCDAAFRARRGRRERTVPRADRSPGDRNPVATGRWSAGRRVHRGELEPHGLA